MMIINQSINLHMRWLMMITITLMIAWMPGNNLQPQIGYGLAGLATLIKGWWIIQDFMELRQAPACIRHILQGWLLLTTTAVTLTAVWQ